jgi:hypothetical protein
MVETEDRVVGKMFARVAFQFQTKLMEVSQVIDPTATVDRVMLIARRWSGTA